MSQPAEVRMPTITVDDRLGLDRQLRIPMPLEQYLRLDAGLRAEWVDGVTIVSPAASNRHQFVSRNVFRLLDASLPDLEVFYETGVHSRTHSYRVPDVTVMRTYEDEGQFYEQVPFANVEVLSRSTRAEDRVRKLMEYLDAGVEQYWIVDPHERSILVLGNAGDHWDTLLELDEEHSTGSVVVGDYGNVELDLEAILG